MLISRTDSCLLIIDVQERLAPAANDPRRVIEGCSRLLKGADVLNVPVIITEQYPKGLGPSIFDIKDAAPQKALYFPKTSLSAVREEGFMEKINALGKKQIIIAGIEEHICVLQTAVELKEKDSTFCRDGRFGQPRRRKQSRRRNTFSTGKYFSDDRRNGFI